MGTVSRAFSIRRMVSLVAKGITVELDLRQLMGIARHRGWIILVVMAIAGIAAFAVSSRQEPQYSATATLLVQTVGADEFTALQASRSIAETYRLLIETDPVLDRVVEELDLPYGAVELEERITTLIVGGTQLIEVSAVDEDAERAARIATTVVEQFQLHLQAQLDQSADQAMRGALNQQVIALIGDFGAAVLKYGDASNPVVQRQADLLSGELAQVEQPSSGLQVTSGGDSSGFTALNAPVELWEPARVPTDPFEPRPLFATLVGLFVGLLLGVGLVALLEFLDNTVKPEQNMQALIGAPVLTAISQVSKLQPGGEQTYTMWRPRSSASEAVRLLRTNLEFASASGKIQKLVITSPGPEEGKSTVAANLGIVMAQAGMKTVIIDADLRRPTLNRIFGVHNERGLTTLLADPNKRWQDHTKKVAVQNLLLIPSGPIPPNPSDLVSSERFRALLSSIQQEADLILIDSPPVLSVSDSLAIGTYADGMILVCHSHHTRVDALREAANAVHQGDIRLVGLVLNRLKGRNGASYYGEYYGQDVASPVSSPGD